MHRHPGVAAPAVAIRLRLEPLYDAPREAPRQLARDRQLEVDPDHRLQRQQVGRRDEEAAGADVAMEGREKTGRLREADREDGLRRELWRGNWPRSIASAAERRSRRGLRRRRSRPGHRRRGRGEAGRFGGGPGLAGERNKRLDQLFRRQKADADALVLHLTQRKGDAMHARHPALRKEAALPIDDLEPQAFARLQADGAVQEEPALRDVRGIGGMRLHLSRAPEAQLDAPGKPAVDPSFHLME